MTKHKEQQIGLFADRTSSSWMLSNQFRLLLSSFAYVLMRSLRALLAGTELAQAQASTIRLKLIKVAARVVISARRVMFHLASSDPHQTLWRRLVERLVPI